MNVQLSINRKLAHVLVAFAVAALAANPYTTARGQSPDSTNLVALDPTFTPWLNGEPSFTPFAIHAFVPQPDEKILVCGRYSSTVYVFGKPNSFQYAYIQRLNANGTSTNCFTQLAPGGIQLSVWLRALAEEANGKLVLGGLFSTLAGQPRTNLARLNADGTLDGGFNPGANSTVYCLALQADGKILVSGIFTTLGGEPRTRIARLNADGTLDRGFNPGADRVVYSCAVQADGKILVGGWLSALGGQPRTNIARLNADGTLDNGFDPGASGDVLSLAVQADGKILVGGVFSMLGGQACSSLGRLINTEPATQGFTRKGSTLTWQRGGTSPEVWRTSFDASTNGVDWFPVGEGVRVPGGWQVSGMNLPAYGTVRARGHATGGQYNGSAWFVETTIALDALPHYTLLEDAEFDIRSGTFGCRIGGMPGQVVVVEGSTDFSTWTPLQTNVLGAMPNSFTDPGTTNYPVRFYRAQLNP